MRPPTVTYSMFALSPIDPVAWMNLGDWFCADHGSDDNGRPLDSTGRVMLRAEIGADDYYGCEECGRPVLWSDAAAAPADIIHAATIAGWSAVETTTGGNCEAIELTRDGFSGNLLITDGDASLPDGGHIVIGAYADNGDSPEEWATLPHDMPRLVRVLWLVAVAHAHYGDDISGLVDAAGLDHYGITGDDVVAASKILTR